MIALSDVGGVGEYTLREVARSWERRIERVPGVRKARMIGVRDRELRVYVDKDRALQFDLTLSEISATIAGNNQNMPGGSFSNAADQEITVRGLGNYVSAESLARTIVRKNPSGTHVTLGEIAEVTSDFERRTTYGYHNGHPAITIRVGKTDEADVSEVVAAVRETVAEEAPFLPAGIEANVTWDSSIFVKKRLGILRSNLILGVAFVVLILWLTVGFRNSLLAIVGVPFSFLTAMLLFPILGITIKPAQPDRLRDGLGHAGR